MPAGLRDAVPGRSWPTHGAVSSFVGATSRRGRWGRPATMKWEERVAAGMASWNGRSVLVVGGAGFIGTNVVRTLLGRGAKVVAIDNEFLGRWSNLEGVPCANVKGDVLDAALLERTLTENKVTHIVHLAGFTSAPMYDEDPRGRIGANFEQFLNVLEAARRHVLPVAYASTSSFYARSPKPFREDAPIVPATPYELGKYIMEQAAHTYHLQYGVRANGLRFFSVYGPYEEHKTRYANNITQFYWSVKNGVAPVVFGDGSQTRDFTYVGDLVDALLLVLEKGRGSEVYNIGTGREHTFNEMIRIINEELGTDVQPRYVANPLKNYVQETLADTSKIARELGWKATTDLRAGIRKLARAPTSFDRAKAEALYAWLPPPKPARRPA